MKFPVFSVGRLSPIFPFQNTDVPLLMLLVDPIELGPYHRRGVSQHLRELARIVRYWQLWANGHRKDTDWIPGRLMELVKTAKALETQQEDLSEAIRALQRIAPFGDLLRCGDSVAGVAAAVARGADGKDAGEHARAFLSRLADETRENWHQRCTRGCLPCTGGAKPDSRVAAALIRLSEWRVIECSLSQPEAVSTDVVGDVLRIAGDVERLSGDLLTLPWEGDRTRLNGFSLRKILLGEVLRDCRLHLSGAKACGHSAKHVAISKSRIFLPHAIRCAQSFFSEASENWETVESFMWLLGRYAHEYLKIEPRIDVHRHLLHLLRSEPGLHSLEPFYRGHFGHVVEVCGLGRLLLATQEGDSGAPLWQKVRAQTGLDTEREVLRQWYLAAMLHDIGYTLNLFHAARRSLEFLRESKAVEELCQGTDRLLKEMPKGLEKFFDFEKDASAGKDHGIIGAHHVQSLLAKINEGRPHAKTDSYKQAVEAIARHNHAATRVSFAKKPFAFLLILADGLQEWNRPRFEYAVAPSMMLSAIQGGAAGSNDAVLRSTLTNLRVGTRGGRLMVRRQPHEPVTFDMTYDSGINANCGVFDLWLSLTDSLQKLDFSGFPFDLAIRLHTPVFRRPYTNEAIPNMVRLQEAANEAHLGFLRDWLPHPPDHGLGSGPVIYEYQPGEQMETVTLHAKQVSITRPLGAPMSMVRKRLPAWRGYSESRCFAGDYAFDRPE